MDSELAKKRSWMAWSWLLMTLLKLLVPDPIKAEALARFDSAIRVTANRFCSRRACKASNRIDSPVPRIGPLLLGH